MNWSHTGNFQWVWKGSRGQWQICKIRNWFCSYRFCIVKPFWRNIIYTSCFFNIYIRDTLGYKRLINRFKNELMWFSGIWVFLTNRGPKIKRFLAHCEAFLYQQRMLQPERCNTSRK
jgi:hypothetical protein